MSFGPDDDGGNGGGGFPRALESALCRQLAGHWPWLVALNAAGPIGQSFALWPVVEPGRVWAWLAGCALSTLLGAGLVAYWRRRRAEAQRHWLHWVAVAATMHGLSAGLSIPLFHEAATPSLVPLLPATICALAGVAVVALHAYRPAMLGMLIGLFAPPWLWGLLGKLEPAAPAIYGLPLAFLIVAAWGWRAHTELRELFALRLENRRLLQIAERRRQAADRATESKSRFLAAASHDLRQPLQGLLLQAEALRLRVEGQEALSALAGRIHRSAAALGTLLNGLLDISKLDVAPSTAQRQRIDLAAMLLDLAAEYRDRAAAKGLRVRARVQGAPVLRSDPVSLQRLLRNLMENALSYTERGGILVAARRRGMHWRIEVWDSGVGIDAADQELVFEELFRVAHAGAPAAGLGLGLALARRLAERLGGRLSLRSRPGHGSVFALTLQQDTFDRPGTLAVDEPAAVVATGKILLIEPDTECRETLDELLRRWGHDVIAAASLDDALRCVAGESRAPDALVCSLRSQTGHVDGVAAIERLRDEFNRSIPGLVLSADTTHAAQTRIADGDCIYVAKPAEPSVLRQWIAQCMTNRLPIRNEGVPSAIEATGTR